MDNHLWLQGIRRDLEAATYSLKGTPVKEAERGYLLAAAEKKFIEAARIPPESLLWQLMICYQTGKEYQDAFITERSRWMLQLKIPDLEERLPWYETMFTILDQGQFQNEGWKSFYKLEAAAQEKIGAELQQKTFLSSSEAAFRLEKLTRHLASKPGRWLRTVKGFREQDKDAQEIDKPTRLATICYFLHTPWNRIMECKEERSAAEIHYQEIRERLPEAALRSVLPGKAVR